MGDAAGGVPDGAAGPEEVVEVAHDGFFGFLLHDHALHGPDAAGRRADPADFTPVVARASDAREAVSGGRVNFTDVFQERHERCAGATEATQMPSLFFFAVGKCEGLGL